MISSFSAFEWTDRQMDKQEYNSRFTQHKWNIDTIYYRFLYSLLQVRLIPQKVSIHFSVWRTSKLQIENIR